MKRSEMLKLMQRTYERIYEANDYKRFYGNVLEFDVLLQAMEEAGMLPPVDRTQSPSTIAAGEAYEWEPEDEK